MTLEVWGIGTCDSCRRARRWMDEQGIGYRWFDLRRSPPSAAQWTRWVEAVGASLLLNRRSKTWRGLDEVERGLVAGAGLAAVLARHPTLMKRPLFDFGDEVRVGFDEAAMRRLQAL